MNMPDRFDEEAEMKNQTTKTFRNATVEASLVFGTCAIASWALRPADRRLAGTRLRRYRPADAGQDGAGPSETHPRAWAVPLGVLVVLYAVSFLTLPAAEAMTYGWAVELGWIDESRPMSH